MKSETLKTSYTDIYYMFYQENRNTYVLKSNIKENFMNPLNDVFLRWLKKCTIIVKHILELCYSIVYYSMY